jgi:tetratricopeptide (TPR) repeat protein
MRTSGTWLSVLCCTALTALAAACSVPSRSAAPAVSAGPDLNIVAETSRLAQEQFALGRFKKSLEIYTQAYDTYHHKGLRRGYAKLGEQIRTAADEAYQRKNYSEAGSTYRILFENGLTTRDFANLLTFDDEYLGAQIAACSRSLTELGLLKYREDKLEEAIVYWKQAIAFDGNNKNVKNAIDRATIQLQQLNSLK